MSAYFDIVIVNIAASQQSDQLLEMNVVFLLPVMHILYHRNIPTVIRESGFVNTLLTPNKSLHCPVLCVIAACRSILNWNNWILVLQKIFPHFILMIGVKRAVAIEVRWLSKPHNFNINQTIQWALSSCMEAVFFRWFIQTFTLIHYPWRSHIVLFLIWCYIHTFVCKLT